MKSEKVLSQKSKVLSLEPRVSHLTSHASHLTSHVSHLISHVLYVVLGTCSLFLFSCGNNGSKILDTPTSGEITIGVDETFGPLIEGQLDTFNSIYSKAKVKAVFLPEAEAFQQLINDSVRLIIVTRKLGESELAYFKSKTLTPRQNKIANDAIALIVNPANTDTLITYYKLIDIFSGKINKWKDLNSSSKLADINIVFDNKNSGTARYVKDKFNAGKDLPANCSAVKTNAEVINYVSQNKNALGVIGVSWISDTDDPKSQKFLNKIKVVAVAPPDTSKGAGDFYKPYQAFIATKEYPLTRELFIVSREARSGLGSGFTAFVAGDKGQRIILKSGLVPATMPVRILGFRDNN